MNDPEVTMPDSIASGTLIAYVKAIEAAGVAIKLVMRAPAPLRSIADQAIRSASSVAANLAEGHGRCGRDRLHFWRIAYGSAKEVDSHLRLLVAATDSCRSLCGSVPLWFARWFQRPLVDSERPRYSVALRSLTTETRH